MKKQEPVAAQPKISVFAGIALNTYLFILYVPLSGSEAAQSAVSDLVGVSRIHAAVVTHYPGDNPGDNLAQFK